MGGAARGGRGDRARGRPGPRVARRPRWSCWTRPRDAGARGDGGGPARAGDRRSPAPLADRAGVTVPRRRAPGPGPRGPAAAAARDRVVRHAPGAAGRGCGRPGDPRPARGPDDRPARGEVVPGRGPGPGAATASGSAGSRETRRSATGWRRSCRRGSATRRWSRSWSRARRWRTSGASWSPTRRPRASRRWRPGAAGRARVLVASVQALLQATLAPGDLPDAASAR